MIILYSTLETLYSNCVLETKTFPKIIKSHLYILVAYFSFDCKEYPLYNRMISMRTVFDIKRIRILTRH